MLSEFRRLYPAGGASAGGGLPSICALDDGIWISQRLGVQFFAGLLDDLGSHSATGRGSLLVDVEPGGPVLLMETAGPAGTSYNEIANFT